MTLLWKLLVLIITTGLVTNFLAGAVVIFFFNASFGFGVMLAVQIINAVIIWYRVSAILRSSGLLEKSTSNPGAGAFQAVIKQDMN